MRVRDTDGKGPSMQTQQLPFLDLLASAASRAEIAEVEFRNSVAREIATRERIRQFAYRRLDLARTMVAALRSCETAAEAHVAGAAAFKRELGWNTETEPRKAVLSAWSSVVAAIWQSLRPDTAAEAAATPESAFADFETWYEAKHGQPFLATFDVELPELPVVEF